MQPQSGWWVRTGLATRQRNMSKSWWIFLEDMKWSVPANLAASTRWTMSSLRESGGLVVIWRTKTRGSCHSAKLLEWMDSKIQSTISFFVSWSPSIQEGIKLHECILQVIFYLHLWLKSLKITVAELNNIFRLHFIPEFLKDVEGWNELRARQPGRFTGQFPFPKEEMTVSSYDWYYINYDLTPSHKQCVRLHCLRATP